MQQEPRTEWAAPAKATPEAAPMIGVDEADTAPHTMIARGSGFTGSIGRSKRNSRRDSRMPLVLPLLVALATIVVTAGGLMTYSDVLGLDAGALHTERLSTPTADATPTAMAAPTTPPSAPSNALYNQQLGCSFGAPHPQPLAIFTAQTAGNPAPTTNEVALTFDDGPTPYSSPPILSVLEHTHTPATFFVEGSYARIWPYLIQREWRDGFAIGVHTWDHPPMTQLTPDQRQFQLGATLDTLHSILGNDACIWLWRPPYGDYNTAVVQQAGTFGLTTVMWDVDPRDWGRPGTDQIVSRVLANAHAGSIILLHDGPALREQTADALPAILEGLRARGLTPVTLPRLLADNNFPDVHVLGVPLRPAQPGAP